MTKILNEGKVERVQDIKKCLYLLDTLDVTSEIFYSKSHETLYRSTIHKAQTTAKVISLIEVAERKWLRPYWSAFHCRNILIQDGNKIIGKLCRRRWCKVCNRIKTYELVEGYKVPLQAFEKESTDGLWFVTLTAPTVKARQLKAEIRKRLKTFNQIKDLLRKDGIKLNGFRKIEVTYNEKEDKYHPHFHLVIQGKKEAETLLKYWMQYHPTANIAGQNIKPIIANGKDLVEVFKYATKDIAKDETTARAEHNIYKAIDGTRIFQPLGKLRKSKAPKEAKQDEANLDHIEPRTEIWEYDNEERDYIASDGSKLIYTGIIEESIMLQSRLQKNSVRTAKNSLKIKLTSDEKEAR